MTSKYFIQLIFTLTIVLALILAWWRFNDWRVATEADFLTRKSVYEAEIVGTGDLLNLQKSLAATTLSRQKLGEYIITKDGITNLLVELERTGREAGVPIKISQGESEKNLVLEVEGDSAFGAWFKFLEIIETMPYVVKIQDFTLTKNDSAEVGGWHGSMNLLFESYLP